MCVDLLRFRFSQYYLVTKVSVAIKSVRLPLAALSPCDACYSLIATGEIHMPSQFQKLERQVT